MTIFGFLILFSVCCMLFLCEAQVSPPHDGKTLIFLPGSTGKIEWSLPGAVIVGVTRLWMFTSRDGLENTLVRVIDDREPEDLSEGLLAINVEKPTTLVLNNVNDSYNGIYKFRFLPKSGKESKSNVFVYIAKKSTVRLSCSSPIQLNEGDDFTCLCKGENGNPPPDVTWYKDGIQFGKTGKYNQTLTLNNVTEQDDGTYTCKVENYPDENFRDEKSIKVTVFFKPTPPKITFEPKTAVIGKQLTIKCESRGHPEPNYTITHNGTKPVNKMKLDIPMVKWSDAGTYKCDVRNRLGNDSSEIKITVEEKRETPSPTKSSTVPLTSTASSGGGGKDVESNGKKKGLSGGAIAGIIIGVLAFIVIIVIVVYCFCCKSRERAAYMKPGGTGRAEKLEDGYRGKGNVSPGGRNDNHEMGEDGNAYDTVNPTGSGESSRGRGKPKKESQPAVYAQVDKENRQGKPLYATLDTVALDSKGSKKRDEDRAQPTEYAAIDHGRTADVPRADLV